MRARFALLFCDVLKTFSYHFLSDITGKEGKRKGRCLEPLEPDSLHVDHTYVANLEETTR